VGLTVAAWRADDQGNLQIIETIPVLTRLIIQPETPSAPSAPLSLTATAANDQKYIDLSWQPPSSNGGRDIELYHIEWESPKGAGNWQDVALLIEQPRGITSYRDSNLSYDTEYNYRISAINSVGEGPPSNEASATPTKGGCLIATATFGSELAPQVQLLREIRDNVLLETSSGSAFMSGFNTIYYTFSPTVAEWERQNEVFKETVRVAITPLITSLSILTYLNIDSEVEMLGYGISIILLNIGMYFVAPTIIIQKLRNKI